MWRFNRLLLLMVIPLCDLSILGASPVASKASVHYVRKTHATNRGATTLETKEKRDGKWIDVDVIQQMNSTK